MQAAISHSWAAKKLRQGQTVIPGILMMGVAVIGALFALFVSSGSFEEYPYSFLMPWIVGLGLVMSIPMFLLYYQGKFSFADPLVFATFSYWFPAFVIGGLFFAVGWSQPNFISLIQDAEHTLPLTITLIGLGYLGLASGYLVPIGSKLGSVVERRLPTTDFPSNALILPAIMLLLSGVLISIIALLLGRFGYQRANEIGSYDGILYLTTLFWLQGSFLLCLIIFRERKWRVTHIPAVILLVTTGLGKFLYSGNRGSVLQLFLIVTLAFILSGRKLTFKATSLAGILLVLGLMLGMIYGTTFRNIKGGEEQISAGRYTESIFQTFDELGRYDLYESTLFGVTNFAGRVDILTTLAVVVSSYEQLEPYEEAYGLDNNIWVDMTTFMVPRVVWEEKPVASDPRKYSELYFNFGESSFAITPVGDLLRNYGIVGVPLGMFVIGVCLRFIYRALIEGHTGVTWRLTLYFMLLTAISYEGFYGTIIPTLFKIAFTSSVGILFVWIVAKFSSQTKLPFRHQRT
ncbi:MAG: oligosaccharide repeat unit polymerase [Pyrinomonadaceae bacterium]